MQQVYEFLKKCEVFYLATWDGARPRVRPFGAVDLFEGSLLIQTGSNKQVAAQMRACPHVELCAYDSGVCLRVAADVREVSSAEACEHMLQAYPYLKDTYHAQAPMALAVFVCYDRECRHQLLFTGQTVVLLKVKEQIFDIGIGQGAGASAPTQIPHNVHTVGQQIQPDCAPQKRILAKHRAAISNGVGRLSFLGDGETFPHFLNGQFFTFGLLGCRH